MRENRSDELDRSRQIGGDLVLDLFVGQFFSRAEQPVGGIADDNVDLPGLCKRVFRRTAYPGEIGDIQLDDSETFAMLVFEIGKAVFTSYRGDDAIPPASTIAAPFPVRDPRMRR